MARLNRASSSRDQTPCDLTKDRISGLPWHILSIIFSCMPILDAVRTSVLAKDWRYKWLLLSEFKLDSNAIPLGQNTTDRRWNIFASLVNRYLRHHIGPIKKINLRANFGSHYPEFCQWLQYLSKQNVEELTIKEIGRIGFVMPSHLFSFKNLNKLWLIGGFVRIPSDFGGFIFLYEVYLRCVRVDGDYLNHLIRSCPNLKQLTLLNMMGVNILRIHAPRLTWLLTDTSVWDIVIESAPCLATAAVVDVPGETEQRTVFNSHAVIRRLLSLGSITDLIISGNMIKLLADYYGIGNFPWRNFNVTSLMFHSLSFETVGVFDFCLSMLNSCPNVQRFIFTFESAKGQKLATKFLLQIRGHFFFPKLRSLEMTCNADVGMGCSLNLLDYICAHSPNLEVLTIRKLGGTKMNDARVRRLLARLRIICPQALIQYRHAGRHTRNV